MESLIEFQHEIKNILLNAKSKDKLSHAYIFQGPKGAGKYQMALYFAKMLYCSENEPCDKCQSCIQINNHEHLNIYEVRSENGKTILKDQIEALQKEFSKTSQVEGKRIYIIHDADLMNTTCQNRLLKFIEEPEDGIIGILLTTNKSGLLSTILSRCQSFTFKAPDENQTKEYLINNKIEPALASIVSKLTNDSEEALKLSTSDEIIKLNELFVRFISLKNELSSVMFLSSNQAYFDDYINTYRFLSLLTYLYSDILKIMSGSLELSLPEYTQIINKYKEKITKEEAIKDLECVYQMIKGIQMNLTPKNAIAYLMVNLV